MSRHCGLQLFRENSEEQSKFKDTSWSLFSKNQNNLFLESLILAQDERWRRA